MMFFALLYYTPLAGPYYKDFQSISVGSHSHLSESQPASPGLILRHYAKSRFARGCESGQHCQRRRRELPPTRFMLLVVQQIPA